MNEFKKYQHIERYGTNEVEGIDVGTVSIFPKLDGTNGSIWLSTGEEVQAGSRNRTLTSEQDNAGFYEHVVNDHRYGNFFYLHPTHRLMGEWLVPHALKTYREDAWRRFYVFDVMNLIGEHMPYDEYQPMLDAFGIDYIQPLAIIKNPTLEDFQNILQQNTFLIQEGKGIGEGIVIKNYDYKNKYGRVTWAKIVTNEFKDEHRKNDGSPKWERSMIEQNIADKYLTKEMVEKTLAKIENAESGWLSQYIPRLLNTVYHDFIVEESWNFIKHFKKPTVDYKRLQSVVTLKIKEFIPERF